MSCFDASLSCLITPVLSYRTPRIVHIGDRDFTPPRVSLTRMALM